MNAPVAQALLIRLSLGLTAGVISFALTTVQGVFRDGAAYPALTALVGISFVVLGLVPQDPASGYDPEGLAHTVPTANGLVHPAVAGVAALASVASLFVMALLSGALRPAGSPASSSESRCWHR